MDPFVIARREPALDDFAGGLVTVIVPVFQGAGVIAGAVRSALRQTYADLEVLVVDDGSTDATAAQLAQIHDPRLRVFRQENAGTAAARNVALSAARGRYIAFLDSDDRWFPDKIRTELALLRSTPGAAIAYSGYFAVDDDGRLLNPAPLRNVAGNALDALLDGDDFLLPSVCLFDRVVFETVGNFNVGRYHEDHEFVLRAGRRYGVVPTGRRLAVYRQSTAGKCRRILADYDRARAEELSVLDDLSETFDGEQRARLRKNVLRALYCRFLMYGFAGHAARLQPEVDLAALLATKKGMLAWLFAKTGFNALALARGGIQSYHRLAAQGGWQRRLASASLELAYD